MNISLPFIRRPIATILLTIAVTLAGLFAFRLLPVAPIPQVDFPTVMVSASMPGASPETMAATIATPLERALGSIAGITQMTSQSSLASTRIIIQFDLSRDINGAARDVQAALSAARNLLPSGMPSAPSYRKLNPSDAPVMILAMTSDAMTLGQMYDIADTVIAQKLSQVKGIGQVSVGGSSAPAVRIELNPTALNHYGVSTANVRTALAATNANRPKGFLESGERNWEINANDQASLASQYLPMIVAYRNGAPIRVGDIAKVDDSVADLRNAGTANGKPAVVLILSRQPGANIVETVDAVRKLLPQITATIPSSIKLDVAMDRSPTVRASLHETEITLLISVALVIMVVFLFLRNLRATLIPSIAVPVSLIGTFGAMYLMGFSLDNFSLMALTIVTGFVVDDAIVVLENVTRHIERGKSVMQATIDGAKEVGFTVISMTLSLIAVFIPILLMSGIVGRMFFEFSMTMTIAILVSLLVSLTTTPMMCALLLKDGDTRKENRFDRLWNRFFDGMVNAYSRALKVVLRHSFITIIVLFATIGLNVYLYAEIPKGFFPNQDTGLLMGGLQGDQALSFQAMKKKMETLAEVVRKDPDVDFVIAATGGGGGGSRNGGNMFITLKDLSQRTSTADQVIARIRAKTTDIAGVSLFLQSNQDIRTGGRSSNAQYQYTLQSDDLTLLRTWEPKIRAALNQLPELADVNTDTQGKGMQTTLKIDRDAAMRLGVNVNLLDSTLNDLFAQRQISTIYSGKNQYHVVMEAAPEYWQSPETLNSTWIAADTNTNTTSPTQSALSSVATITASGRQSSATSLAQTISTTSSAQVPLSAFASFERTNAALSVSHQGQFIASTISFNLNPRYALSDAKIAISNAMATLGVPTEVHGGFEGTAATFNSSQSSQPLLILAALVTIYIVLGMLYESYVHPITILSTLPSAGIGALLALQLTGLEFDLIGLIGVILLIGIVKKNAILMIDFAVDAERTQNLTAFDAIFEAARMRFRPIMMTTMAALLGALPLALASGYGSELRRPLGISIVGGLIVSQILTLFTTPVVYLYMDRLRGWSLRRWPLLNRIKHIRFPRKR